ncbi:MAG: divergent PAP2 family protein [Alkalispirochaetaceae bacterium]
MVSSRIFLSALFSWFLAQIIKVAVETVRGEHRGSRDVLNTLVWRTGGMPSSHSSLVTGIATSIGFIHGTSSPLFTLALFYGMLTIRDALGVRRSAGAQAQALNRLGAKLNLEYGIAFEPVKEINGHTPAEVAVGVLLGFFLGMAFSLL